MNDGQAKKSVALLQSGGRDSAAAALHLFEDGFDVIALTLSANAAVQVHEPKKRAIELKAKYNNYNWAMVDFSEWDRSIQKWVAEQLPVELPKSCLLCAVSKITAILPFCSKHSIENISLGYTDYQSEWAEQTPVSIESLKRNLANLGFNLLLPSQHYKSKADVMQILAANSLTPESLENPCCISKWGTQKVTNELISQSIDLGFAYLSENTPIIQIVETVGDISR